MLRRWTDWWGEFRRQITPSFSIKPLLAYFFTAVAFFGYSKDQFTKWEGWQKLGLDSAYLLLIPVVILTWIAAIAWDRTRTPNIRIGELEEYEKNAYWSLVVENDGEQTVTARASAIRLTDKDGKNTDVIDWSYLLVWGKERNKEVVLSRGIPGKLRLFTLSTANTKELPLLLWTVNDEETDLWDLSDLASPSDEEPEEGEEYRSPDQKIPICQENEERILTIVIVFHEIKATQETRGTPRREKECQFRIKHEEKHPLKFRIEKIT